MTHLGRHRVAEGHAAIGAKQEALQLATLVRDCGVADIARNVAVVRLSRLEPDRQRPQQLRPHHLRLARAALEPLAHAERARLFMLPSRDIVAVWRGEAEAARRTAKAAIEHMFAGDESLPISPERLWEEYTLPGDAEAVMAIVRGPDDPPATQAEAAKLIPLDLASLAAFEQQLAHADMARFVRRLPIAALRPKGGLTLAWESRLFDIDELAGCLSPRHDLQAEPWLFRRLTRTLDRRMLALLGAHGELAQAGPLAFQLNIASLLSPEFLRFDEMLPAALRGKVTLDLMPEDVLSNPSAFLFARDFARARGYRLALSGVVAALLPILPVRRLGLDLVHLRWSEALRSADLAALQAEPGRIVLSGVESEAVLFWGAAQGISLFSGTRVSDVLRMHARIGNDAAVALPLPLPTPQPQPLPISMA